MTLRLRQMAGFLLAHLPLCLFALGLMLSVTYMFSQRSDQARRSEGARLVLHDIMWKLKSGQPLLAVRQFSPELQSEEERFARDWQALTQELGELKSWEIAHVGVLQENKKIRIYCLMTFERGKRYARFRFYLEHDGWKAARISGSGLMFPDNDQDIQERPEEG